MRFLSSAASEFGVAEHSYVVGGAVRNYLLSQPIKDLDVTIDVVRSERGSDWFAERLKRAIPVRSSFVTNQYGVAILTIAESWSLHGCEMKGETIEIANTRKESYGGDQGKGYKPHMVEPATIEEDLLRREFTFNTLLWRLSSLGEGPSGAEVLDLLGSGRADLDGAVLRTPREPARTFSDDPTRMLRAVKFVARYGFRIADDVFTSIQCCTESLKRMPWDAVRKILTDDILFGRNPRESIKLLEDLKLSKALIEIMKAEPGFASALGRTMADLDPLVVLDLLDFGWPMKTFLAQFSKGERELLRAYLTPLDEDARRKFVAGMNNPPVDKMRIFDVCSVPTSERGMVAQVARQLLVHDPSLMDRGSDLAAAVERAVKERLSGAAQG
jgi:tRNA nucleotidyltransferase/poly(A) polymerase